MSNENKLKQLLEIAVENGWNCHKHSKSLFNWIMGKTKNAKFSNNLSHLIVYEHVGKYNSLDYLVTYWEPNEISFIEALIKVNTNEVKSTHPNYYRTIWVEIESSQRLDFLFNTFSHLLKD